jgi:2-polyprenyl-3-methyl-5-hydroxy-6-metoxy-1,4-benzoquinol methylase
MGSHKTAISRKGPSAPLKLILDKEKICGPILDYGSGHGADSRHLSNLNYKVTSYDPYWAPISLRNRDSSYSTIICNYVLNVVDESEEKNILLNIKNLLLPNGVAYISVRRDIKKEGVTTKGLQRNVTLDLPKVYERKGSFCIYKVEKEHL